MEWKYLLTFFSNIESYKIDLNNCDYPVSSVWTEVIQANPHLRFVSMYRQALVHESSELNCSLIE